MPLRRLAGLITGSIDPLRVPNAPTNVSATAATGSASVSFTAPTNTGGGAITGYAAGSVPGSVLGTSATSPITVNGLTNGTSYVFQVWAINAYGPGPYAVTNSVTPTAPAARGLFAGTGNVVNVIQYITISTTGDATDFGDMTQTQAYLAGLSSATRAVFGGGLSGGAAKDIVMSYVTVATAGNATFFGNLTVGRYRLGAINSSTRGVFGSGANSLGDTNVLDYVTIATTGNATDFGDATENVGSSWAALASPTRGVFNLPTAATTMLFYITTATTGNTANFGNLTVRRSFATGCSNSTRGIFAGGFVGGSTTSNVIDYITIATTGDATDFGDLTVARYYASAAADSTRGVVAGGQNSGGTFFNVIDYVTIDTTGNATDFGDLITTVSAFMAGCSNGNGGLA